MRKGTASTRRSVLSSGLLTGLSLSIVNGAAAVAGALLARKFGRDAETDGFLAAYGIYLVLVLGAQTFRVVVVPDLTRAVENGRLATETRAYAVALLVPSIVLSAAAILARGPIADMLTAEPDAAAIARRALPWLVPAAFAQLLAALAASSLAAAGSYATAAVAYATGAAANLVLFVVLADAHGLVSLAWGVAANGAITLALPLAALWRRGLLHGGGTAEAAVLRRLRRLVEGAAVPLALQLLYLVCLRFAADLGTGSATIFSYGYLLAATLVAGTAASLSLVASASLTRRGLDASQAAAYVVHAAWLSLAVIAAAAGVFALVGERLVAAVLGPEYSGEVGSDLGRLVVALAPWMLAATAFSLTFPLLFVTGRDRLLVPLALVALVVHVPVVWVLRDAFGLTGTAIALAATTLAVIAVLQALIAPRMLVLAAVGLAETVAWIGGFALLAFGGLGLLVGGIPAALGGIAAYVLLLAVLRPRGMREAWAYARAL